MPNRFWHVAWLSLLVLSSLHAGEQNKSPLPEPLTLEYALSLAEDDHPRLLAAKYLLDSFSAKRQQAEAMDDYSATLTGRIRWLDLPADVGVYNTGINADHALGINIKKPLLDSGASSNQIKSAQLFEDGARKQYQSVLQLRRELIMQRYFDVLLADLQFFRENERMATAYISLDRAKTRQSLGQAEELEILKLERQYQKVRRDRYYYEGQQRITRASLAEALNRPGMLSSILNKPALPQLERKPPELEVLQALARANNPELMALRRNVAASSSAVEAVRARDGFNMEAVLGYNGYSFQPASRENWFVGVNFNYPLTNGGRSDADIAYALSQKYQLQNQLSDAENQLDQAVLTAWMELGTLRIERQEMQALSDYEGFYLDRTRTVYEQGLQTTLGDAMTRITDAEWRLSQTEYKIALMWLKLEGLIGLPYEQFPPLENK